MLRPIHPLSVYLPDNSVHDEDVAKQSHDANDRVERRDGHGDDHPPGAPNRALRLRGVQLAFLREGDVKGDDRVQVGQRELRSGDRVRLHVHLTEAHLLYSSCYDLMREKKKVENGSEAEIDGIYINFSCLKSRKNR